ncbi:hypothetical protein [Diaphorobacter ruginosibacter]|uniref:hypothetical protein n=1 Tax=Diaphorobacter ruginosibacter TaxID=1715720 RepID=UPI00333E92E8
MAADAVIKKKKAMHIGCIAFFVAARFRDRAPLGNSRRRVAWSVGPYLFSGSAGK